MPLEAAPFINSLVITNPTDADPKSQGAAHLRLTKSALKATFPNLTGAVTPTHEELNFVDGVTSPIQAQLDAEILARSNAITAETLARGAADALLAPKNAPIFTGPVTLPATGSGATEAVRKDYADGLAFAAALPAQAGNAGKFVKTNGTVASWALAIPLQTGNAGKFLTTDGTTESWSIVTPGDHEVVVHTGGAGAAGSGSTNVYVRRFTTTLRSVGTAITYADNAVSGATFTINEPGLYSINYSDGNVSNAGLQMGVSINYATVTSFIGVPIANKLMVTTNTQVNRVGSVSRVVRLALNDVIRPHSESMTMTTNDVFFAITKVGV